MLETAYQTIKKYDMIQDSDCIVVGISGGADSVSLFHFLCNIQSQYNLTLVGVHIHHGIRGIDADSDADYVEQLCKSYNIKCEIFRYDIHKEAVELKVTEEEAGRIIRYKVFAQVLKKYDANKIAVAHNMNDQSETLIMRLFRGTGLRGLTGIPPIRDNIIRPLIQCSRESIEQYCQENNLEYKKDYTNDMNIYTRNKIRLQLIPWIKENFNPSIIYTLSKMSMLLQEEEDYIEGQAKLAYKLCTVSQNNKKVQLSINALKNYPDVIKKRVIRIALQYLRKDLHDIELTHIVEAIKLINKDTGKKINLTEGIIIEKQYSVLCFYMNNKKINKNYCYNINLNGELYIEEANLYIKSEIKYKDCANFFGEKSNNLCTKVFDYDKINDNVNIRTRLAGDKIYLKGSGTKKLKEFFIDIKLPREQRNTIALLAAGENIIWVLGHRTSGAYDIDENTKTILCIQYKNLKQGD